MVYYHEVMCHAEKLVHFLQCQDYSKGLYNQNIAIFTISSKLQVHLQTNLVYSKNGITSFKVKVTAKFKVLVNVCPGNIF